MEKLVTEHMTIEVLERTDPTSILLEWRGRCAERYPQRVIGPFLRQVLAVASERRAPIEMDFKLLSFLNSAAITAIVHFLRECHRTGVRLVLNFDRQSSWQKITSDAVRALSHGDPLLEVRT